MSHTEALLALEPGQRIVFGGNRMATVDAELAAAFEAGDRLVVVQEDGALLHIPHGAHALVAGAVDRATSAFEALASVGDEQISDFFEQFARRLDDDVAFAAILAANAVDVSSAAARGRSTTRLALSEAMRRDMIAGLRVWRDTPGDRGAVVETVAHEGWTVTARRAPLGVVAFVFEGRPNVFADATGVLRTGNTAVLRIGSDALGTARAIVAEALHPALVDAGLPESSVVLVDSPARATGWALFDDHRVALAVARGSGEAVAQLGAVARQAGVPVSLHGTGGAWLVASATADAERFRHSVRHSLDRKVCNTLNVCCIVAARADDLVPVFVEALREAAAGRGTAPRLHVLDASRSFVAPELFAETVTVGRVGGAVDEPFASVIDEAGLAVEWEWETSPEVSLVVVDDLTHALALFDRHSPHLVASLISRDTVEHDEFYARCSAPFIGNGFTRWVDGQFALDRPELGLSNWEHGRLLARSAVLSGDSVFTVRLTADVTDTGLHR
ncbi:MAG: proA [Ilumatobacteraceae bacterium]|nr:proA [Ilumatobacteraceae bacterium]